MEVSVKARYEKGVLHLLEPLNLSDGTVVAVTLGSTVDASQLTEEEVRQMMELSKDYHEWFQYSKLLPPDDGEYDIVEALAANRRWSAGHPEKP